MEQKIIKKKEKIKIIKNQKQKEIIKEVIVEKPKEEKSYHPTHITFVTISN
jgi:hypothetical protein